MKTKVIIIIFLINFSWLSAQSQVELWRIFEITLTGPGSGNPFLDVELSADFIHLNDTIHIHGFYDGNKIYKIRFMPESEGEWKYITHSSNKSLDRKKGHFICIPPAPGNHGPVFVKDTTYLAYADGKPYYSFGTTCYGWVHQGDSLAELTLNTLENGYFNKLRMCIFPKSYDWNHNEPLYYPFEGEPLKKWDYSRLNPVFFQNIEKRIKQLDDLGIEADLIVFHPYDRWGFSTMDRKTDDLYINYIVARFASYKNVWWSMANEFDFMSGKKAEDWDHYFELFSRLDPYHHLRSIHNGGRMYDHSNPLVTHVSIQNEDTHRAREYQNKYHKPVIYDECRYEGNIPWSWGDLSAKSMTEKFWRGFLNGAHVGHSETYLVEKHLELPAQSNEKMWWSKGGILRGESPERIKFLRTIMESGPSPLRPANLVANWMPYASLKYGDEYFLIYFNDDQPRAIVLNLPGNSSYKIEVIDTWNMTINPIEQKYSGQCMIDLPQKPYIALRIVKQN
jgi:hypothetical protein